MGRSLGRFVSDDTAATIVWALIDRETGSAFNLTGATALMFEARETGTSRVVATGTPTLTATPTDGKIVAAIGGYTWPALAAGEVRRYDVRVKFTLASLVYRIPDGQPDVVLREQWP